jgi:hypothetical protein
VARRIAVRLRDIYLPDPQQVALELFGDQVLEGRVIDVSDNQQPGGAYAVVEFPQLDTPAVVPCDCLLPASAEESRPQRARA